MPVLGILEKIVCMYVCTSVYACVYVIMNRIKKLRTSLSTADEIRGEENGCYLLPQFCCTLLNRYSTSVCLLVYS